MKGHDPSTGRIHSRYVGYSSIRFIHQENVAAERFECSPPIEPIVAPIFCGWGNEGAHCTSERAKLKNLSIWLEPAWTKLYIEKKN